MVQDQRRFTAAVRLLNQQQLMVVATPVTAAPGTVEQANKVRVSGGASGGTRPIATFGDSSSVSGGSYTDIKYPASPLTVTNDGKITPWRVP